MRYTKTENGKLAISGKSQSLSPKLRSTLIIINGERTVDEILKLVGGIGVVASDLKQLVDLGYISDIEEVKDVAAKSQELLTSVDANENNLVVLSDAQSRYKIAYPLATQVTAQLGLRGFRLNLAVEAAGSYSQLLALLPKIKESVGAEKSLALERALRGDS